MSQRQNLKGSEGSSAAVSNGFMGNFVLRGNAVHFCDADVKTNGEVYRAILTDVLPPLEENVFADRDKWCFQQDSTLPYKVKKKHKIGC